MTQSGFQFSNPIISKINYTLHPDFNNKTGDAISITNSFNTNIPPINKEDRNAVVELNISVGSEDATKEPFHIELTIGAAFKWDKPYDDETIQNLLSINAPALLLSYARPIISAITNMSPYRAYNVPFYNFTE